MVSGCVVFAWLLFILRTVISAVDLEPVVEELNETVICTNDHMDVIIPSAFFLNKVPPVYVEDLHLNDAECRGEEIGDVFVFSIRRNLSECGTTMVSDDTHIMFINTIHNNFSDIITRSYINITFVCRYPINYMVQQPNNENMIRVDVRSITLNTEDGNFSVSMLLYKDEAFEDRWTTVPSLTLDENIFVNVFMQEYCLPFWWCSDGPLTPEYGSLASVSVSQSSFGYSVAYHIPAQLMLRLERCWATPTRDPYGNIQYTFIRDSCPVLANKQTLSVLKNGEGPEAMFRIQMFKFVGRSHTYVFLHCNVQICHSSMSVCKPNCTTEDGLMRIRRDIPLSHTVSYGPIRRLLTASENPSLNPSGVPPVETLVLGGLLVVLLFITGVLGRLWHRSRRFYPAQEAQLTLSNIHHISEVAS